MQSDQDEVARGLRMAAVAVISAIVTATVVIGAGEAWLSRAAADGPPSPAPPLIRTAGQAATLITARLPGTGGISSPL